MKLICLNTWGGRAGKEKLLNFITANKDADFFCFQEIWADSYADYSHRLAGGIPLNSLDIWADGLQQITGALHTHSPFFHPHFLDSYGLLTLVKRDIQIADSGELFVYKEKGYIPEDDLGKHARNIQFVDIVIFGKKITIINFHGLWNGQGKGDSHDRLLQSKKIINFLKTLNNPFILCGDFNLLPGTKSLKIFREFGLRDLIEENNITSTRTSLYKKENKFADYVFVSSGIKVNLFEVRPEEVSDHSPLQLEFEF